jgi:hypothetical protein
MVELLELTHRRVRQELVDLLQDGDEGMLAKAVKRVIEQVKESESQLAKQFAAKEALMTRSSLRGGRFEDVLAARLPLLVRGMGRVERCGTTGGASAGNAGDYLVIVDNTTTPGEELRIVVEAKARKNRLSANEIRNELRLGRVNRGAAAAVLVANSAAALPDGIGFGQVSETDFYAALDTDLEDETALSCALYMARVAALASRPGPAGSDLDAHAVEREAAAIYDLMKQFAVIEASHSKAEKAIAAARATSADLRTDITAAIRRLEAGIQT